jgi:hypothetical protein
VPDLKLSRRLAWLLVRAYPPRFRQDVGLGLVDTLDDRMRAARARGVARPVVWFRAVLDTIRNAPVEWMFAARDGLKTVPKKRTTMDTLWQDVRYALRLWRRKPVLAAVAVVTLALGIGANSAIFSIVNAVLLRPLPYAEPGRVVMLWSHWINWSKTWVSEPELADYQTLRSLEHVAAFDSDSFNLTGSGEPIRVRAAQVQADVFAALGVRPIVGRLFTREEDTPGQPHVVVLTEGLWRSQFGSDPSIVGRTIQLDATPYTVVGVTPPA